ncbi:MAG: ybhF 2 [Firmicutes bacterium]|nr:ybhF 2 [Bacillota bacterium]
MITMDNVTKTFDHTIAVNGVSLNIKAGEIFGLVGPDGAGKTTIIRMLTGILTPTSGELSVLGATNPEKVKHRLGYVPQRFSLYGDLTVMENIRFIGSLYGETTKKINMLATQILDFSKLLPFKDRYAANLSGGMKQKLALAAGLMHRPTLFFLDEPTTGVDPVSRREFWQMLYQLNKDGTTIVVSTPYMDEADLCTKIAFMHNGRLVSCAPPEELRQSYPYKVFELCTPDRNIKTRLGASVILDINSFGEKYHLITANIPNAITEVTDAITTATIPITALNEISPTLEDVFVALASEVN